MRRRGWGDTTRSGSVGAGDAAVWWRPQSICGRKPPRSRAQPTSITVSTAATEPPVIIARISMWGLHAVRVTGEHVLSHIATGDLLRSAGDAGPAGDGVLRDA